ncbi:antigen peptide transporter 2 [Gadus macrocephalus]|uniref:antigen peptide transporter 2 n=1 Tax=Gadus macrocephalus TaxID=80720 RepID=UPI0028CB92D5|nr:antigen peptide transporter 2 [Gadus macrocephalus]
MKWKTYGCVLLLDIMFWLILFAELVLLQFPSCGGLPGLWAFAVLKIILINTWTVYIDDKPTPVVNRFVTLVCLLLPVFESVRTLVGFSTFNGSPVPTLGMIVLAQISSIIACAFWEMDLTHGQKKKGGQNLGSTAVLKRVLKYFMPDRLYLVFAFFFLILGVACDAYIPLYQGRVIDMLRGQLYQTHFLKNLGWLALFSLGSPLFAALRGGTFMWILSRLNQRVKRLLYSNLLQQEIQFFEDNKPGSLASRLHSDVDKMGKTVALNCNLLVRSTIKGVLMLQLMVRLSWQLTLLTVVEMRLLSLIQSQYSVYSKEMKEELQDCQAENNRLATQTLGSIRVVRSCGAEPYEAGVYGRALDQMRDLKTRMGLYSATFLLLRRLLNVGIKVLILVQGRSLISSGQITVGDLLAFFLYQGPLSASIREFLYATGEFESTAGVITKVLGYLDRTPNAKPAGRLAPEALAGGISFQNVTFAYPSTPDKPVLKSLSLEVRPGKMTALVGPSGGGKTSCVSLLKRLYEPQDGQILLDGQPLHSYQHKYLHQKVTLVPQNPVLFSGSLGSNIGYGLENCTLGMLQEAARRASADGFIASLEQNYDTDVGECGVKLGAGQRQCVAIARALVRTPRVIILDEATSSLDADVQHAVARQLRGQGVTLLVVAHQLRTVEEADHIVFMEGGAIVEQGTHLELMASEARYYRSYQALF